MLHRNYLANDLIKLDNIYFNWKIYKSKN